MSDAVIGSNFGDEGKGMVTDWCVRQRPVRSVVVRFNGGAQAGHTVETINGHRHVFSHFGSGSFHGADTYLGKNFICNPIVFKDERKRLRTVGLDPIVIVHPGARVTTYFDMMANQLIEAARTKRHGSCGLGIFETIKRHEKIPFTVEDAVPAFEVIKDYFVERLLEATSQDVVDDADRRGYMSHKHYQQWIQDFDAFRRRAQVYQLPHDHYEHVVFEGAQGLLLDMDYHAGAPHLTPSNTGFFGALGDAADLGVNEVNIYYVSRTYLTRHGAGPLKGEKPCDLPDETNKPNEFQGTLRFAPLHPHQLLPQIAKDLDRCRAAAPNIHLRPNIVITHANSLGHFTEAQEGWLQAMKYVASVINAERIWWSHGKTADDMRIFTDMAFARK